MVFFYFLRGIQMQIVNAFQKFDRVKKALKGEIEFSDYKFGDTKIYRMVLEELGGNEAAADLFMTSEQGGYTHAELKKIKYRIAFYKNYNASKRVSKPVETI